MCICFSGSWNTHSLLYFVTMNYSASRILFRVWVFLLFFVMQAAQVCLCFYFTPTGNKPELILVISLYLACLCPCPSALQISGWGYRCRCFPHSAWIPREPAAKQNRKIIRSFKEHVILEKVQLKWLILLSKLCVITFYGEILTFNFYQCCNWVQQELRVLNVAHNFWTFRHWSPGGW